MVPFKKRDKRFFFIQNTFHLSAKCKYKWFHFRSFPVNKITFCNRNIVLQHRRRIKSLIKELMYYRVFFRRHPYLPHPLQAAGSLNNRVFTSSKIYYLFLIVYCYFYIFIAICCGKVKNHSTRNNAQKAENIMKQLK